MAGHQQNDGTYVDAPEAGAVSGSHILVECLDGVCATQLAELLVHVVSAATRVVADPDAKVLDLEGSSFMNLRWFS
jgi:hypothetical protein